MLQFLLHEHVTNNTSTTWDASLPPPSANRSVSLRHTRRYCACAAPAQGRQGPASSHWSFTSWGRGLGPLAQLAPGSGRRPAVALAPGQVRSDGKSLPRRAVPRAVGPFAVIIPVRAKPSLTNAVK